MIQVCSQCGTRWNVRERRREWCPRCRGALMAPLADAPPADPRWGTYGGPPPATPARPPGSSAWQRATPRLPPGYRWIAVRPGAAPATRRLRRDRGPTPRYAVMPRWGLSDRAELAPAPAEKPARTGPWTAVVRASLFAGVLVLGLTALVYVVRYVLLVINRNILLNSLLAIAVDWLGVVASLASIGVAVTCWLLLVRWLIARRTAAFAHYGIPEPRSARALWVGCLVPLVNLLWAPVYIIELAEIEDHYVRLRRPILQWWIAWILSYLASTFAIATSFATDAQAIANNTVLMVFAYLLAAIALAAAARIVEGFERKPVDRPAHRWIMAGSDGPTRPAGEPARPVDAAPVELKGQEPAALGS
ncbi:DUF4328 domain-containing protein [Mycobacterium sp. 050134]|uniref:DUF4328 domain-containing protein n=1 Tax=Mycobacterium sp. 050134 TaxID=3096111 RepID=UPI002ED8988B